MLAGTASGSGKTTIACGLLRALRGRGLRVQAAKCGPDYIDPAFHERVLGVPSRNLDLFLAGEALVRRLLAEGGRDADLTLIEGAMGFYDGISGTEEASSFQLASLTGTPVVLVVDAHGKALSVAAEVGGFLRFRTPSQVVGVILNRASAGFYPVLREVVERETGVPVLGYLPMLDRGRFESRHLGLVGADEVADLQTRIDLIAQALAATVDLDALVACALGAEELSFEPAAPIEPLPTHPVIALARDAAFSFYYEDSLRLLEDFGARLVPFSPLADERLPEGCSGLYLGGGYPELHAKRLSANTALRGQLREAITHGLPTIAECGGFLYLHEMLEDQQGTYWPMVGVVAGKASRGERLTQFGYVTLTARGDSLLARAGDQVPAHEFHYWQSDHAGAAFRACKPKSGRQWDAVVATDTLHAGFPHLYLPAVPHMAHRFVAACAAFDGREGAC